MSQFIPFCKPNKKKGVRRWTNCSNQIPTSFCHSTMKPFLVIPKTKKMRMYDTSGMLSNFVQDITSNDDARYYFALQSEISIGLS